MKPNPFLLFSALVLAIPLASAPAPKSAGAKRQALEQKPVAELPEDYEAVLAKARKAKASLQVLPIRDKAGNEHAFSFAQAALESGLFSKVSLGDELGRADYAVAGSCESGHQLSLGGGPGFGPWMELTASADLDLIFEGEVFARFRKEGAAGQVYSAPPHTPAKLLAAAESGRSRLFQLALYKIAKDIRKRSGL